MLPTNDHGPRSRRDIVLANLLVQTSHGDRTAFVLLYEATQSAVFAYVQDIVRDPAQSEEVMQETYLRLWQTSGAYDTTRGSAHGWIRLLARRCSIDCVRKAESLRRLDEHDFHSTAVVVYDDAHAAAELRSDVADLHAAMDTLTDLERQAIHLAYFQGQTHEQTAVSLQVPPGTAKGRIRSAVIRLRRALVPIEDESSESMG